MDREIIDELSSKVNELHRLTEDLLQKSDNFPRSIVMQNGY